MAVPAAMMTRRAAFKWDYAAQPKEDVTECNACGSKLWVTLATKDRYGFPVTSHCCHSCGLVFISPRMTKEAYAEFYRGTYRDLVEWYMPGSPPVSAESQTRYAKKIIPLLEPFVKKPEAVLDIGGSPGACAHAVAGHFGTPHYRVVDPADGEPFEDWQPDASYDIILCCQTVDHLLDLRGSLEKMRSLLTDDGVLWVDAVDWLYMLRRFSKKVKMGHSVVEGIAKLDHPYGLNEVTFLALLDLAGLQAVRVAYQGSHVGFVCKKREPAKYLLQGCESGILASVRKAEAEAEWI